MGASELQLMLSNFSRVVQDWRELLGKYQILPLECLYVDEEESDGLMPRGLFEQSPSMALFVTLLRCLRQRRRQATHSKLTCTAISRPSGPTSFARASWRIGKMD